MLPVYQLQGELQSHHISTAQTAGTGWGICRRTRKRFTGMARPCAHNAACPHLQRGVDGREQVTTVPRRQARGGHVACAPAGGRVSDPSTEVKTPARDKQRCVQSGLANASQAWRART